MTYRTWMTMGICALAVCACTEAPPERAGDAPADSAAGPAAAAPGDSAATTIAVHPTLPPYGFVLHQAQAGTVDSIVVSSGGRHVQTLQPQGNHVGPETQVERLAAIDLDFDGYADLSLLSDVAVVNSHSEYWRFDPAASRFVPAGTFETLTPDSAARELTDFNRGGDAGRMWTAARWKWAGTSLVKVAEEEQARAEGSERYVHVTRALRDGRMVETGRDTLDGAALREGPTWMAP